MAWPGGKCTRVRSIACTGPLLPAAIRRTKDVHRPSFPIIPDRAGVLNCIPILQEDAAPVAAVTRAEETGQAGRSARRRIAILTGVN